MPVIVTIILSIILLIFFLIIASSFYFFHVAIERKPQGFMIKSPDLAEYASGEPVFDTSWIEGQVFEDLEVKSHDGLLLRAYYLSAPVPTNKTVILAHGYSSRAKPDMGAFAQIYHEQFGFNILLPDDRGHGESQGSYIGFGWPDRLDFLKWISYLTQRTGPDAEIVLHGISMGGATVLMTSGEYLPENVKCIISDCAYTSVKDILTYQLTRTYKLPAFPFVQLTSLLCKLYAGYFFGEASTIAQVRKSNRPMLFIHGATDAFVPVAMVDQLYEAAPGYKEKKIYPDSGHGLSCVNHKEDYIQLVQTFVEKFVSQG